MANPGGARSAYVPRNTLGELGMVTIPSIFGIATVHTAFDEASGQLKDADAITRFGTFLTELDWFTAALKAERSAHGSLEIKQNKPATATQPPAAR